MILEHQVTYDRLERDAQRLARAQAAINAAARAAELRAAEVRRQTQATLARVNATLGRLR